MKKIILFLFSVLILPLYAAEKTLWEKYWTYDLRQYPDTQIDKYFQDLIFLAKQDGAAPESQARVKRAHYTNKKLKVLFIIPYSEARYPLELAARFPLEYDMIPASLFSKKAHTGKGYTKVKRGWIEEMLDAVELQKFNVIVTKDAPMDMLTDAERQRVRTWFQNGLGWVDMGLIGTVDSKNIRNELPLTGGAWMKQGKPEVTEEHFINSGIPDITARIKVRQKNRGTILMNIGDDPALAVRQFAKGRMVSHPYGWIHQDANYSLLMRSIIWAAAKESGTALEAMIPGMTVSGPLPATVNQPTAGLRIYWKFLHENRISRASGSADVKNGEAQIRLSAKLPAGRGTLHYSLVNAKKELLDWGQTSVNFPDHGISLEVKLPEMFDRKGNVFSGSFTVNNEHPSLQKFYYRILLCDGQNRILPYFTDGTAVIPRGQHKRLSFRFDCNWAFMHGSVGFMNFFLYSPDRKQILQLKRVPFFTPLPPADALTDWQCGVWGTEPSINIGKMFPWDGLTSTFAPVLRKHGVNTVADGVWNYPDDLIPLAKEGFHVHTEYLAPLFGTWYKVYKDHIFMPKKNYVPPWFASGRSKLENLTKRVTQLRKLGVISYACDEEIGLGPGEVCFSAESLTMFRKWVMQKYGTLEKVNKIWGTSYKTSNEITGILLADALKKDVSNPAQWMDFRFFMEDCYNGAIEEYARLGKKNAPEAYFGYGAGPHNEIPTQGHNRARLGKTITSSVEYLGPFFRQGSVFRNFEVLGSRKPAMLMSVAGYPYHMVPSEQQYPACSWFTILHNGCGIMYYATIHPSLWGKLHPTGAPNGATKRMEAANAPLLNGLGKLILTSQRQAQIGIYYSRPSLYVWAWKKERNKTATGKQSAETLKKMVESLRDDPGGGLIADKKESGTAELIPAHSFAAMRELAAESGFGYDIVFEDQLLSGTLAAQYKILLLPTVLCLSQKEFAALKSFIARGGVLITDMQTGIYDEHGRRNASLKEIESFLGIQRRTSKIHYGRVKTILKDSGKTLEGFAREDIVPASSAISLGSVDALAVYRTYGKGHILYLNMIPKKGGKWGQWAWDPMQISSGLVDTTVALGQKSGLKQPAVSGMPDTDIVSFRNPSGEYLFLSRGYQKHPEKEYTLKLETAKHIHDMRTRTYLGKKTNLMIPMPPSAFTAAYSFTDYKVDTITAFTQNPVQQGKKASIRIQPHFIGTAPKQLILNCCVYNPAGGKEQRFSQNLLWSKEQDTLDFYPTVSEQSGRWKVIVREVAGSAETTLYFNMKGK